MVCSLAEGKEKAGALSAEDFGGERYYRGAYG